MPKSQKLERIQQTLNQLRDNPTSDSAIDSLRQALKSKYSIAVAQAAKIIGEFSIHQLIPDLVTAFGKLMINPTQTDPGCTAKWRIVEALYKMEYSEETLFLQGIRHVQMEAVWGGKEDTATSLRSTSAMGLVRMNYPDVLVELADLLADPYPSVRAAAAKAIAYNENPQGVPLLRLKVKIGDKDPQVLGECFAALLKLAPSQSLTLITSFLDAPEEPICETAALALGESRLHEANDILHSWWKRTVSRELRRTGLLALALLRQDQAIEFLLSLILEGKNPDAGDAVAALSIYRQDEVLWQRVCQAGSERGDVSLLQAIKDYH